MIYKNEIPVLEYDDTSAEVIKPNHGAEDLVLPEKCIYAFLGDTIDRYAESVHAEVVESFETITKTYPVYVVRSEKETFTLAQAPLGASASAQFMDFLIACGCKKIISAGSCGVLRNFEENEFLVPIKALRDEGTSYQYLQASRYCYINPKALQAIEKTFTRLHLPYHECTTWTTDGFFRETEDMVAYRKEEGCDVVEMECAALAACAEKRGAQFGQIFFTADSLAGMDGHDERNWGKDSLEKALHLCVEILRSC